MTPALEANLKNAAAQSGHRVDEQVETVRSGYVDELAGTRDMLDKRYDDLKSGRVTPIDGEAFFETLRQREEELLNPDTPS